MSAHTIYWGGGDRSPTAAPESWLSPGELARWRAAGPHAEMFIMKRWLLRLAMGATITTPIEVEQVCPHCGATDHGRVRARRTPGPWTQVALSSHGELAAAAAAAGRIGIDLVLVDQATDAALDHAWTPAEQASVDAAENTALQRARLWARKEAALKAVGVGLRVEPSTVDVLGETVSVAGVRLHLSDRLEPGHRAVIAHACHSPSGEVTLSPER